MENGDDSKQVKVSMNFIVTKDFRRQYKAFAALNEASMTELLYKSFYQYIKDEKSRKE